MSKSFNVAQRTLYDIRDNNSYTVRKLADGNCWMTTNLNLSLSTNTPIIGSKNDGSAFTYTPTSCGGTNGSCAMNGNTMAGSGMWYYSWYAATAGEGKTTDVNVDVDGSICPVGWRLPPNYSAQVNKSFGGLTNSYGVTSDGENGNSSNVMVSYPINITRDKCRYNGGNPDYGVHGYYQSSTAAESSDSSYVFVQFDPTGNNGNNKVYPQGVDPKGYAFNIRCVAL